MTPTFPTPAHYELGRRRGLSAGDVESEARRFLDWAKATGAKPRDPVTSFARWLDRAASRIPGDVNAPGVAPTQEPPAPRRFPIRRSTFEPGEWCIPLPLADAATPEEHRDARQRGRQLERLASLLDAEHPGAGTIFLDQIDLYDRGIGEAKRCAVEIADRYATERSKP